MKTLDKTRRALAGFELIFGLLAMSALSSVLTSCNIKVIPITNVSAYPAPCLAPAKFSMEVRRNNHPGPISGTGGYLLINGERIRMRGPSTGPYGLYEYDGMVPFDGNVRYRFQFIYTQGINVTGSSNPNFITRPSNNYIVRPMGELTWSSPDVSTVPDNFISPEVSAFRPLRTINLTKLLMSSFSGPVSTSTTLTLKNEYSVPIIIGPPQAYDAATGGPISNFSISPPAGTLFPLTLSPNDAVTFDISHNDTFSGSTIFKSGRIKFEWYSGAGVSSTPPCFYGPVWINITYTYEPR